MYRSENAGSLATLGTMPDAMMINSKCAALVDCGVTIDRPEGSSSRCAETAVEIETEG